MGEVVVRQEEADRSSQGRVAGIGLVKEAVGNQNHPGPWVLNHEAKPGGSRGWRMGGREGSLKVPNSILTGSNNGVAENETRSTMCDRWRGKGPRQVSGGKTIASLTAVLMFQCQFRKRRGV